LGRSGGKEKKKVKNERVRVLESHLNRVFWDIKPKRKGKSREKKHGDGGDFHKTIRAFHSVIGYRAGKEKNKECANRTLNSSRRRTVHKRTEKEPR